MKKKGRLKGREGEEEDDKGDEPPLIVLAGFATDGRKGKPREVYGQSWR